MLNVTTLFTYSREQLRAFIIKKSPPVVFSRANITNVKSSRIEEGFNLSILIAFTKQDGQVNYHLRGPFFQKRRLLADS
jgi:hypothetical protein